MTPPNTKSGRLPINKRPSQRAPAKHDELFGNALTLPPEIVEELDKKGLEGRFIDAAQLYKMGGYHPKGWTPYRRDVKAGATVGGDGVDWKFGTDPEGVIRRGSVVLAVKTKENAQRHREYLAQRADKLNPSRFDAEKAEELRSMAKENGAGVIVHEGYEENDGK